MSQQLKLLRELREAATDPEGAYLVRTRLRRALVAVTRASFGRECDPAVTRAARQLEQRALHLCQPSEALDLRWKSQWSEVEADLDALEAALRAAA